MIATEIGAGDGLGNQLFRYITLRCMALDHGMDWGIVGSETMANNMHSSCGLYFMDLDYGKEVPKEQDVYKRQYHGFLYQGRPASGRRSFL